MKETDPSSRPPELQDYPSHKAGEFIRQKMEAASTLTSEMVTRQMGTAFDAHRHRDGYEPKGIQKSISNRHQYLRDMEGKQYGDDVMAAFRAETPVEQVLEEWAPTPYSPDAGEPIDDYLARLDLQAEKDEHDLGFLFPPLEQEDSNDPYPREP